jgi:RimJ/RimL family protein N-acetyltransferase
MAKGRSTATPSGQAERVAVVAAERPLTCLTVKVPPERLSTDLVVLSRSGPGHAEAISAAALTSLDHLRPWMPWATPAGVSVPAQRQRLGSQRWAPDSDYDYVMLHPQLGAIIGGCSLMRRQTPGVLEIGYWVHIDHTGRGVATAAAGLLTSAARQMDGVRQITIRCDAANAPSAAVPRHLGYRLEGILAEHFEVPASTGRTMVWVLDVGAPADGNPTYDGQPGPRGPAEG